MNPSATDDLHDKESHFHDAWADSVRPEDVRVRESFEAPTAFENREILRRMGDLRGKRVLDIGGGLGESSVYFAIQGADVTYTDLSPGMADFASRLAAHHGVKIHTAVCAAEAVDTLGGDFDFVYIANTIHHVHDRAALLRAMHAALKPGGRFFSWDPIAYNPVINVYRRMATDVRTEDESPLTFADLKLARTLFRDVGHREFWVSTLSLFLKYYLIDRVHPNQDRYWKRILRETPRSLWWWRPLSALDAALTRLPLVRRLAWNMVMWGTK
ncbi:MAG TPA: class I SAM-dependent methyltransferase [Tepidisphaeraceae bacterium]|nr:class I SAM-dependent methyltransferase [Tepidisphaeraceae bacterium]